VAALLPFVIVSVIQGFATLENIRTLAESRLNASAIAVAERERDRFVIAQHLLMTVAANPDVISMSDRCNEALAAGLRDYSAIVNFVRSDAEGNARCSVLPFDEGTNFSRDSWWQKGIQADRLTIIKSPVIGRISKKEILILFLPLRSADGRQIGGLSAGISLDELRNSIARAPETRTGSVSIISADGDIIARGSQRQDFQSSELAPQTGSLRVKSSSGKEWMYSTARLYSDDLVVVYAQPRDQLMATAVSQARSSFLLPLGSILLASIAIWLGTNRLVLRWLRDLARIAGKFAHGDFDGNREQFAKAPEEIASLSADLHVMAETIHKRNQELTLVLEAKTRLTHEVHHRVKNNLQIINSMLTLQVARTQESEARAVLYQTAARISALALIHRLLYDKDAENEHGSVAIDDLFTQLCHQLRALPRRPKNVELTGHATGGSILVDIAIPLTLFVVEVVTNAFQHAFDPDGAGTVELRFHQDGDEATLSITDNGRGYDHADEPGQMGAELMRAFATQLNARLTVESTPGRGTKVMLFLPLRNRN
jgi:two-component sensor histidine kinase